VATFTPPTYDQPIENRLGDYGVSFPVGKVVYITSGNTVTEVHSFQDPDGVDDMKDGSGDFGKALFRRGLTYEVSASEALLLTTAGYSLG
jgi:hypothetical protein